MRGKLIVFLLYSLITNITSTEPIHMDVVFVMYEDCKGIWFQDCITTLLLGTFL